MTDNLKTYILDILSILVPGGFLMAILNQVPDVRDAFLSVFPLNAEVWLNAVVYIGTAYTLGHFIFFIGSFLDDWIFEKVKRVFYTDHALVAHVIVYKTEKTGIEDSRVINAFKWSCLWLQANKSEMYAGVERHIAESKFFRSMVVVLVVALLTFINDCKVDRWLVPVLIFFIILSIIRYLTQRRKSIETAYHAVVAASDRTYALNAIKPIVARLNEKNIGRERELPKSSRAIGLWVLILYNTLYKVVLVVNLCLNPFRKTDKHDL